MLPIRRVHRIDPAVYVHGGVDRPQNLREFFFRFGFGHSADASQFLNAPLAAFPPTTEPRSMNFAYATNLIPFAHATPELARATASLSASTDKIQPSLSRSSPQAPTVGPLVCGQVRCRAISEHPLPCIQQSIDLCPRTAEFGSHFLCSQDFIHGTVLRSEILKKLLRVRIDKVD
jgi:hypothetical protein